MSISFKDLYKKFNLVPVKKGNDKAPLISINKYGNKKIPVSEFTTDRFGIIGGYDGLEILDIDNKLNNADYHFNLIKEHCNVDNMPHISTPSGGYHIYYKSPGNIESAQKLARKWDGVKVNKKGHPVPEVLIETRAIGTYVVAPPAKNYVVINGSLLNVPYIDKDSRDFIIEFCKAQNEYVSESKIKGDSKPNASGTYEGEKSGDKFNSDGLSDIISLLNSYGWKSTDNINWTRPGKKKGVSATLGKCISRSGNKLFHVFSSSTELNDENYTLFGLYTELVHNGDFKASAKELGKKYNIRPTPTTSTATPSSSKKQAPQPARKERDIQKYLRVGNSYFKKIDNSLERWSRQNIIDDYDKDALGSIPKFDKFVNEPNHIDYQPIIKSIFYNKYSPPCVMPSAEEGEFPTTNILLKHLFGKQYDIILDWIQLSYLNPLQRLPVVCLVGEENETGKSGFGRLMKYIYGDNYASIKLSEYKSEFNSTYIDKNIVCIEEGKMTLEEAEKLKKDSTDDQAFLRQMHVDRVKIRHFAKYILTSNRANDFIQLSKDDNRFWIKKVGVFPEENFDPLFDEKVKKEVPYFLNFLFTRELHVKEKEGRFWIGAHRYIGDEFYNIIINSRDELITEFYAKILDDLDARRQTQVCGSTVKLIEWYGGNYRLNATAIKKAIERDFPDIKLSCGRYDRYGSDLSTKDFRGTYFEISSKMLQKALGIVYDLPEEDEEKDVFDEISINKQEEMPF